MRYLPVVFLSVALFSAMKEAEANSPQPLIVGGNNASVAEVPGRH